MEVFFTYILSSTFCLTILLIAYELLLKKETFFRLNRFLLLGVIIISHIIPLLELPVFTNLTISTNNVQQLPVVIKNLGSEMLYAHETGLGLESLAKYLLITISALLLIKFLYSILTIINMVRQGEKEKRQGYSIVYTRSEVSPFSFLNYIIINKNDIQKSDLDKVLIHENKHIREWHTFDLFIIEILLVFHWFNPFVYLLKKRLVMCHEYQADQAVVEVTKDEKSYQEFLFNMIGTRNKYQIINSLNNSLIKNRFVMMNKLKSHKLALIKYLAVLPVIAGLLFMFSCQKTTKSAPESKNEAIRKGEGNILPEDDETTKLLKADLGDVTFLKEFKSDVKADGIEKFKMVLAGNSVFRFGIYDDPANDGNTELMLWDSTSMLASSLNGVKMGSMTTFDYKIEKTGIYKLLVKPKDSKGGRSRVVIAFVKRAE